MSSPFELCLTLKQHTPIIHFQHHQLDVSISYLPFFSAIKCLIVFICLSSITIVASATPNTNTNSTNKHYDYLETEMKAYREFIEKERETHRKQIDDFQKTVVEERKNHTDFVEKIYWFVGGIISVGLFLLGFFGWNTIAGIKNSAQDIRNQGEKEIAQYKEELEKAKSKLRDVELAYNAEKGKMLSDITSADNEYQRLIKDINHRIQLHQGNYALVCPHQEKLQQMWESEIPQFQTRVHKFTKITGTHYTLSFDTTDVIIYRSNVDASGEDELLKILVRMLKESNKNIPIIVYCKGREEFVRGDTEKAINSYHLSSIANLFVTLIDNTAAAYRVKRLGDPDMVRTKI